MSSKRTMKMPSKIGYDFLYLVDLIRLGNKMKILSKPMKNKILCHLKIPRTIGDKTPLSHSISKKIEFYLYIFFIYTTDNFFLNIPRIFFLNTTDIFRLID